MSELVMIDFQQDGYFTYPNPVETARAETNLDNASLVWLRAFAAAREGKFEGIGQLVEDLSGLRNPGQLRKTYAELVGDAGLDSHIELVRLMLSDRDNSLGNSTARLYAGILAAVGKLADVPTLLDTYLRMRADKDSEIIPVWISDMIEPDGEESPRPSDYFDIEDYYSSVMSRYETLVEELGSAEIHVLEGATFGVVSLAHTMVNRLNLDDFIPEYRQRFEASTGIDCRSFYRDGRFQPLKAAAILEDFINGPAPERFEEGVRYFFGHRIQ